MNRFVTLAFALSLAACGGKSSPNTATTGTTATPADHDHSGHHHDGDATGSAAGSAAPVASEPVTPAQPPAPDPAQVKAELLAAETAAFEKAQPVFEKHCARCHKKGGKSATEKKRGHFDMTTYPFAGHHADTISAEIRKTLGMTGEKPRMPFDKPGAVKGDELALIGAWADAFDKAHAGGAHEGGGHDHGGHDHRKPAGTPKPQGHDHGHKH